jgi:DNA anti-recombination protein RmuC
MTKQTEVEVAGIKFRGGKIFLLLTALSTLGGGAWATFEFYKDYMDMKEIVQNIDTTEIKNQQEQITVKLDEAIAYTRDIKTGLRDDILSIEKQVDRVEDKLRETEQEVRDIVVNAEERFENKRDALQNDYDEKANRLSESSQTRMDDLTEKVERDMNDLEIRLNKKLQRSLDNPLAN